MPYDEFCGLEPDEFESICGAWSRMNKRRERDARERTRVLAAICIQPHVRRKVTPKQLLSLPWDNKKIKNQKEEKMSMEERKERFETLIKREM